MRIATLFFFLVLTVPLTAQPLSKPLRSVPAAHVSATCPVGDAATLLDVNAVRARLFNTGALFWRSGKDGYLYRVPVEGNARSLFTAALMIGGIVENELRMSASEYGPYELWPGDLAGTLAEASDCVERDRMYSVF
ncbi:MAG: hypothetical protein AAF752_08580, partial [Bacteroidota bacterium]